MMIRPPSDAFEFVREVGLATFGDSWIPRVALSIGCEGSEASIKQRAGVIARDEERLSRWALQTLDAGAARINDVRYSVASAMEDRRIERVSAANSAKKIDLEALRAHVRANEPPMVADFLEPFVDGRGVEIGDSALAASYRVVACCSTTAMASTGILEREPMPGDRWRPMSEYAYDRTYVYAARGRRPPRALSRFVSLRLRSAGCVLPSRSTNPVASTGV
jgi:hypothetical protein